jgi:PA-IL-like protein
VPLWLILVFALAPAPEPQPVDWTNRVNVTATDRTLKKTAGCEGCEDAGAASWQMIPGGDGYVEFTVGEADTLWMAGLNTLNESTWYNDIDFGFRFNGNGRADIVESGTYQQGDDIPYRSGDIFRVAVARGRAQYLKNGEVIRESRRLPRYPLFLDVAFSSAGATIVNATIAGDRALVTSEPQRDRFASLGRATIAGEIIGVGSAERWIDTGLIVQAGDALTISADGTVHLSGDGKDTATPAGSRRRDQNAPLPQSPAGALIARIGTAAPMLIGAQRAFPKSPAGGRLFLGINEAQLDDNSGAYRVNVTLRPR